MKKRIVCMLLAMVMALAIFPIEAFAVTTVQGAYVGRPFEQTIDIVTDATSYGVDTKTLPAGLSVSGSWTNKNNTYELSLKLEGTPTKAGTYNFSVTYYKPDGSKKSTVSYIMNIGEKAPFDFVKEDSLFLASWPTKTEYYLHDTMDTTGMKVTVTAYSKDKKNSAGEYIGFSYDVTNLCSVTPTYFTQDDTAISAVVKCTLPVDEAGTLKELVTTFRVTFKEADPNTVTGIELLSSPTKLTYTKGESLNTSGLTLRVKKYSGATEDIEKGFTCEPTVLDTVGTQTITVKYDDKTLTFDVTVTEAVASVPSSVSSSVAPPQPSSSVPESSSEPESVVESEVSSEPESVVEPEPSSEPESIVEPESSEPEAEPVDAPVEEKGGVPFWLWIIIGLGVIAIGAGVALFVIGKKKLDD